MAASSKRRFETWKLAGVLVGAAIVAVALGLSSRPDSIEVRIVRPTYQDIDRTVASTGKVIPSNDFKARANFPGMVEKVYVQLGQTVHPGQMLIKLKDPFASARVASARAALQSAQLSNQNIRQGGSQEDRIGLAGEKLRAQMDLTAATNALKTIKELEKNGAASPAEVEACNQRLQLATAALKTLTERIDNRYSANENASWAARVSEAQATLAAERVTYANANMTSPISGTVYLVPVSTYDFVPSGADLLRIADLNHLQIRASFDETDIGQLVAGQPVKVTWDGRPNQSWHGHIEHPPLAAMASGSRSVGECTITVDDAKGDLLPDTNVTVVVTIQHRAHVLTVPREALHTEGTANSFVYRVVNGRLLRTPVQVGIVNLARVELTEGVSSADTIALQAADNRELKNNLPVTMSQ